VGGLPVTGTVVLDSPAPTGGITVRLLTTDLSVSVVPDSVTVLAGATRATFPIATDPVPSRQRLLIVAQLGVQQQTAPLTLLPRPAAP
jgi:trimeric autotransporter adhesin